MRRLLLFAFVLAGWLAGGCATSSSLTRPGVSLDSLRAENTVLRDRNQALRDSLRFYDDLESGQYYRERRALRDQITRMAYEVGVLRDGGQTVAVLRADEVFASARPDSVSSAGVDTLKALAVHLRKTYPARTIRVEGHADSAPLAGALERRFGSNWGLSAARATSVVDRLIELSGLDGNHFVAVGYGSSRPVASNDVAAGRRRNRRIRIAVLPPPGSYSRPFETSW
jgi:chemotaxis protein MotB